MEITQTQQRQQRAKAAGLLLSLHEQGNLDQPERWTWKALDLLPAWCLADANYRQQLQQICGALYLSPEIRFWIDKPALEAMESVIGKSMFARIMNHADAMALPREPLAPVVRQASINSTSVQPAELHSFLMSAGATVLSATVHESLPREMLVGSLGEGLARSSGQFEDEKTDVLNRDSALALHYVAIALLDSSDEATVGAA